MMKRLFLHICIFAIFCVSMASTARADAMTGYTVTDLGVGGATLSGATGANATLTAPDGKTVYSFPRTDNSVANPDSLVAQFPSLPNPNANTPSNGSGSTDLHYYYVQYVAGPAFLNANGVAADTEVSGVAGHINLAGSGVVTLQRQADGTFAFTPFSSGVGSPNNADTGGIIAHALDLNNHNQLLSETTNAQNGDPIFMISNLNTGIVTNLQSLLPTWHLDNIGNGISLSDNGQILVYGDNQSTDWKPESFLLTPDGLSSAPIATPEPSTLVTLAVAGVGLVVRRRWKSR